jgi:hypothetical protein
MGFCFVKPAQVEIGRAQIPVSFNQEIRALLAGSQSEEIFSEVTSLSELPSDQTKYP